MTAYNTTPTPRPHHNRTIWPQTALAALCVLDQQLADPTNPDPAETAHCASNLLWALSRTTPAEIGNAIFADARVRFLAVRANFAGLAPPACVVADADAWSPDGCYEVALVLYNSAANQIRAAEARHKDKESDIP